MKTTTVFLALSLALAGAAQATHLIALEGSADCDGWSLNGVVRFGSAVSEVTITYNVDLVQDQVVVLNATASFPVTTDAPWQEVPFVASGTWGEDLCGTYVVNGSATMTYPGFEETMTFTTPELVCDCPPPPDEGCYRTPGYWKNHDWPVEGLTIGGVAMTRDELMAILWAPVGGDATVILAKHLIAAKLNVIAGGDAGIQDVIDDADAFLVEHPVGSRPSGADKDEALALKDELVAYNEQGCPGDDTDYGDKAASVESRSWSDVKSLYR
ncbi:MAG TPA: hypothetical protein PLL30_01435 [Candidatus Krumholzibacteria bacterium]|nr:hypothetical protein [Candidatus Krumholzibacteria bacterium]HPD70426.1 hypothetical protein [Candidatus Krumholzibacteria bacterium]HRY39874.1 hypothetical protein [Candidatus Krumholzibacteria bacterium]